MQIIKLEGFDIKQISLRLTDDRIQKFNELIDKVCGKTVKDSDAWSDKVRLFIDKLYDDYVRRNPASDTQVSEQSHTQKNSCPYRAEVSDTEIECGNIKKWKTKKPVKMSKASCQSCWRRKEYIRQKKQTPQEPQTEPEPKPVHKPKKTIDEIVNQTGVCLNPLKTSQTRPLTCIHCRNTYLPKWKACQEIQHEIKTRPMTRRMFFDGIIEKTKKKEDDWYQGKPEDIIIQSGDQHGDLTGDL